MLILISILTILLLSFIISLYGIYNLVRRLEAYEDVVEIQTKYLQDIGNTIYEGKRYIDMIDAKGIFQADDEVGTFFDAIKVIQQNLNRYAQEVENAEKKEE